MDVDDLPRRTASRAGDLANQLASEALDSLSLAELDVRIALLEAEIVRVRRHRDRADAHRVAAEALFGSGPKPAPPPPASVPDRAGP